MNQLKKDKSLYKIWSYIPHFLSFIYIKFICLSYSSYTWIWRKSYLELMFYLKPFLSCRVKIFWSMVWNYLSHLMNDCNVSIQILVKSFCWIGVFVITCNFTQVAIIRFGNAMTRDIVGTRYSMLRRLQRIKRHNDNVVWFTVYCCLLFTYMEIWNKTKNNIATLVNI